MKRFVKIIRNTFFILIGIVITTAILINIGSFQNFLAHKTTKYLSQKLKTTVEVKNVRFHLFNKFNLDGLLIKDLKDDTLLYAGTAQVRLKDLVFGGNPKTIYYIGLEDSKIYLNRSKNSDVWNYQFLEEAFASESKKESSNNEFDFQIILKRLKLKNLYFYYKDQWVGQDYEVAAKDFEVNPNNFDFKKRVIDIKNIIGNKVLVGVLDYPGGRPPRPVGYNPYPLDTTPFNPDGWRINIKKVAIANSSFYFECPMVKPPVSGYFDYEHIRVTNINSKVENIKIINDTIWGKANNLTAHERSGVSINSLKGDIKVSPVIAEIKNLLLKTDHSILKDYYAMHYRRFPDFIDYIDKVVMEGHLHGATIGINDIVFFAPEMKRFANMAAQLSGNGYGTVDNLEANNIFFKDKYSVIKGNLSMKGLPEVEETLFEFQNLDILSSGEAVYYYAPEAIGQDIIDLDKLKAIQFQGNYSGLIRDFSAIGDVKTNLGNLKADLNMKLPEGEKAQYNGNLEANNFHIGTIFKQNTLGATSFALKVDGEGLGPKTVNTKLKGNISKLEFNNYPYQHIEVNGNLSQQKFDGTLSITDSNANFDFNGDIDFAQEIPLYHFDAVVRKVNLKPLNLSKDNLELSSELHIRMEGKNLDDLVGDALITNINLRHEGNKINLDKIILSSQILDEGRHLINLSGNNFDATLDGVFNPSDILSAGQMYFSYYLPEYFKTPTKLSQSKNIQIDLKTGNVSDLLALLNPDLRLNDSANITARFDLEQQNMTLLGKLYGLSFGKITTHSNVLSGSGDFRQLDLNLNTNDVSFGDENVISNLQFASSISRDTANFSVTTNSQATIESATIKGIAFAHQDSLHLNFKPSEFNFNKDLWKVNSGSKLVFAKKHLGIQNLLLHSGNQSIEINTDKNALKGNNAFVRLNNLNVFPLNNFLDLNGNKISGFINGTGQLIGLMDSTHVNFNLEAQNIKLHNERIGDINLVGYYRTVNNKLTLSPQTVIKIDKATAGISGVFDLNKPDSIVIGNGKILLKAAPIHWINPFLDEYVSELEGTASGNVNFSGSMKNLNAEGEVNLSDAAFIPDITGVKYFIPSGKAKIKNSSFIINSMNVYDKNRNQAILSGDINHKGLSKFNFNLRVTSDKLQVIDLEDKHGDLFYGNVDAKITMTITGPWENLVMNVSGSPLPNSKLFLVVDYSGDLSSYNYIYFKKKEEQNQTSAPVSSNNDQFNFILNAVVNPNLETTLFVDKEIGDKIWAKGNGNIILEIPMDGEMKMTGNYIITEGDYNFSFQQMQVLNYQKRFIIDPNSTIKWNGPITDADLDVTARTPVKARLYDLIADEAERQNLLTKEEKQEARLRQNVEVVMKMQGLLSKPDFTFKMNLTDGHSVGTYAYQKLERINSDDKQALIQVTSLLLLGQFVPPEGINSSAISSGTINNMSELFSSVASSQLTNFANKVLGMQDLSVGVKYKNYSMSDINQLNALNYYNRNELGVNFKKNFFNDRLIVEGGGVYDWGQGDYNSNLAGDFRMEYLITEDGRVRTSVFRTSDYDPLYSLTAIKRQGINLSYRKSFNNIKDFLSAQNQGTSTLLKTKLSADQSGNPFDPVIQKLYREAMRADSPEDEKATH